MRAQAEIEAKLQQCLDLLDFSTAELEDFFNRPPLRTPQGEQVPLAYVRDRLASLDLRPDVDADYTILVYGSSEDEAPKGEYSMHETVWYAQCAMVMPVREGTTTRLCMVQSPVDEAIGPFIAWLYGNDEEELYDALVHGDAHSETYLTSFCMLIRSSSCINHKISGVVRAVFDSLGETSP